MTFVRRATTAAALLAVPVAAAFAISTGVSAAPATVGAPLLVQVGDTPSVVQVGDTSSVVQVGDTSSALVDTESAVTAPAGATVTEVTYAKKRKKATRKPAAAKAKTPENSAQIPAVEASVINLTNAQRLANGCGAMHPDNRLTAAALAHSSDMVVHNYFDHTGSDGSDFVARESTAGYASTNAAAENIAWGYPSPQAVVAAWMASPGHRANILNCANIAVGVGLAKKADGTAFWTQDFGRV